MDLKKTPTKTPKSTLFGSAFNAMKNLFTPEIDSRKFFNHSSASSSNENTPHLDISDLRREFSQLHLGDSDSINPTEMNDSESFKTTFSRMEESFKSVDSTFEGDNTQLNPLNETLLVTTPVLSLNVYLVKGEDARLSEDSFILNSSSGPMNSSFDRKSLGDLNLNVTKNDNVDVGVDVTLVETCVKSGLGSSVVPRELLRESNSDINVESKSDLFTENKHQQISNLPLTTFECKIENVSGELLNNEKNQMPANHNLKIGEMPEMSDNFQNYVDTIEETLDKSNENIVDSFRVGTTLEKNEYINKKGFAERSFSVKSVIEELLDKVMSNQEIKPHKLELSKSPKQIENPNITFPMETMSKSLTLTESEEGIDFMLPTTATKPLESEDVFEVLTISEVKNLESVSPSTGKNLFCLENSKEEAPKRTTNVHLETSAGSETSLPCSFETTANHNSWKDMSNVMKDPHSLPISPILFGTDIPDSMIIKEHNKVQDSYDENSLSNMLFRGNGENNFICNLPVEITSNTDVTDAYKEEKPNVEFSDGIKKPILVLTETKDSLKKNLNKLELSSVQSKNNEVSDCYSVIHQQRDLPALEEEFSNLSLALANDETLELENEKKDLPVTDECKVPMMLSPLHLGTTLNTSESEKLSFSAESPRAVRDVGVTKPMSPLNLNQEIVEFKIPESEEFAEMSMNHSNSELKIKINDVTQNLNESYNSGIKYTPAEDNTNPKSPTPFSIVEKTLLEINSNQQELTEKKLELPKEDHPENFETQTNYFDTTFSPVKDILMALQSPPTDAQWSKPKPRMSVLMKFDPLFDQPFSPVLPVVTAEEVANELEALDASDIQLLSGADNYDHCWQNEIAVDQDSAPSKKQLSPILEVSRISPDITFDIKESTYGYPNDEKLRLKISPVTPDYSFLNNHGSDLFFENRENTPPADDIRGEKFLSKQINKSGGNILKTLDQNMGLIWSGDGSVKTESTRESVLFKFDPIYDKLPEDPTIFVSSVTGPKVEEENPPPSSSTTPESIKKKKLELQNLKELYLERKRFFEEKEDIYNDKIAQVTSEMILLQDKIAESQSRQCDFDFRLNELNSIPKTLDLLAKEYKRVIDSLLKDQEVIGKESGESVQKVCHEYEVLTTHLINAEAALFDVDAKYQKIASSMGGLYESQLEGENRVNDLRRKLAGLDEHCRVHQEAVQKEHSEMEFKRRQTIDEYSKDSARLKAQVRKSEVTMHNLQESLDKKTAENTKLAMFCEELINGKK